MRKLITAVVVVVILFVGADRIVHAVAEHELAAQIRSSQQLPATPKVHLDGFPFLTQVIRGRYDGGRIVVEGLRTPRMRIDRLDATVTGVRLPLSALVHRNVSRVPVRHVTATVHIGYPALAAALDVPGLTLAGSGGRLTVSVTTNATVVGRVMLSGSAAIGVSGGTLTVHDVRLGAQGGSVPASVLDPAAKRIARTVPLNDLPYGLHLTGLRVTDSGVDVTAAATDTVLAG